MMESARQRAFFASILFRPHAPQTQVRNLDDNCCCSRRKGVIRGMSTPIEVSVLMPCLNEHETVGTCVRKALRALNYSKYKFGITFPPLTGKQRAGVST